jgi:oligopeptide transport system substrate-binding protein
MRGLLLLVLLAGLVPAALAESVLRRGNGPEAETLDPHKAEGVPASNILRDLYEGLTSEAPDGRLIPGAASRWELSADGRIYTFHLRPEARWSNGDPLTAEDFASGLRRSVDPATGSNYSQILSPILNADAIIAGRLPAGQLGVRALDAHTLRIELKEPTPYFLGQLAHASSYPIHTASLREHGDQFARPGRLVSNGAYRLRDWVIQSHIELERNPHYWADAATRIDRVLFVTTEDLNSEFKRYRAGELDWTEQIPANQADWIRAHLADEFSVHPYLGVYYYGLNLTRPPFADNPKLRLALALAIDREVIARKVLASGEIPAYNWVPPGVENYTPALPDWAALTREQRLDQARRLYAEAGYSRERPLRVEIRYNTHEDHRRIAVVIAAMWKQWLGVDVRLLNEEWKVFLQNRRLKDKTQAFRAAWIGDYNDANTFLDLMHSAHGLNDVGFADPRYDALLAAAGAELDPARRAALLRQAEALLLEVLPVIPVYFYVTKRLVKPWVKGWQGNIMDHHRTQYLYLESP